MKVPKFIRENVLLKMTSLNAPVIITRLGISLYINRMVSLYFGEVGFNIISQLRDLLQILTSVTSLGIFNGIVKYVAEFKKDEAGREKLFTTAFTFFLIASGLSFLLLFFGAGFISDYLFQSREYAWVIRVVAMVAPCIGLQRIFNGVVNGLSQYKKFVKIDLISYLLGAGLTIYFVLQDQLSYVLFSISITPLFQLGVLVLIFKTELKKYIPFRKLRMASPMAKTLLAFTLMSFFSTVVLSSLNIEIRNMITRSISDTQAGLWSAMLSLSKQYMSFSIIIFSMYVIPKFATIYTKRDFTRELKNIYKMLLPIFGTGMLLVYLFRGFIMDLVFPGLNHEQLEPLFKWQLVGDFVRLISMVLAYQFITKKLVRTFIFTELLSLGLFYSFSWYLLGDYGIEGVTIAHLLRYLIYLVVVLFLAFRYFEKQKAQAA
ncbi:MAG: O-antigen translocase [Bacteroidota bacterium]